MPAPRAHQLAPTSHRGAPPRAEARGEDGRDDAGEPAAHREQPIVAFSTEYGSGGRLAPTIQLRRFSHEESRRGARVTQSPRVASPTGTRRTWPAWPRKRALTFGASGELPALAVRRMLRQHDCADSVASDGGGGGAGEAEQDEQAGMARAAAAAQVRASERSAPAQVCRGGESADYIVRKKGTGGSHHDLAHLHDASARGGRGWRRLIRGGEHVG